MTRSKTKALKEALNALVLNVSTKSELKQKEYQEETLVHLIHVHEGSNQEETLVHLIHVHEGSNQEETLVHLIHVHEGSNTSLFEP